MSGTTSGEVSTDAVQNIDVVQFQHWLTGYEAAPDFGFLEDKSQAGPSVTMSDAEVKKLMAELAIDNNPAGDQSDDQSDDQSTHHVEEAHQDMLHVQGDDVVGKAELAAYNLQANTRYAGFTAQCFQEFVNEWSNGETSQVEGDDSVGEAECTARPGQADENDADASNLPKSVWDDWVKESVRQPYPEAVGESGEGDMPEAFQGLGCQGDDASWPFGQFGVGGNAELKEDVGVAESTARPVQADENDADASNLPMSVWDAWVKECVRQPYPDNFVFESLQGFELEEVGESGGGGMPEAVQGLECQAAASRPIEEFGVWGNAGLNKNNENTQDPVTPPPTPYPPPPAVSPMRKGTKDGGKRKRSPPRSNEKMPMSKETVWKPLVVAQMPTKRRRKPNQIKTEQGFHFVPQD